MHNIPGGIRPRVPRVQEQDKDTGSSETPFKYCRKARYHQCPSDQWPGIADKITDYLLQKSGA
jgi:hypothetical protein